MAEGDQSRAADWSHEAVPLPGEPVDAMGSATEAGRWIEAYTTLLAFERGILASVKERMASLSNDEYLEAVRKTNVEPLEELIRDFEQRLARWQGRAG